MHTFVNLLNEVGMLSSIPRSGFAFLGTGQQSVAEHSYRTAIIGIVLAKMSTEQVDLHKLLMICLLHDLPEARMGDLNYVQKKYLTPNLDKVLQEIKTESPLGPAIVEWIEEYENHQSLESLIAHDADQIELLLMLKQEIEKGNQRGLEWYENACKRLKTFMGQELANEIKTTPSDQWWLKNKNDSHWIDGGKSKNQSTKS